MANLGLGDAISIALGGGALLFAGSGFSMGAKGRNGNSVPLAKEFANQLCDDIGLARLNNLPLAAQKVMDATGYGIEHIRKRLKENFLVGEVAQHHKDILNVPWKRIYTTNYDNVIEMAAPPSRPPTPFTTRTPPNVIDFSRPSSIHLHGYVGLVDYDLELTDFVLTKNDYLADKLRDTKWLRGLLSDIELSRTAIFVGYSLQDIDIARVLYAKREWREKTIFIVAKEVGPEEEYTLESFGTVHKIGGAAFAQEILAISRDFVAPAIVEELRSFRKVLIPTTDPGKVTDDDRFDLLIKGQVKTEAIAAQSLVGGAQERYVVPRKELDLIKDTIFRPMKNIVLHSNLGNGKTTFCAQLAYELSKSKYNYYRLDREFTNAIKEIEKICADQAHHVIEIEGYSRNIPLIEAIEHHRNERTACVFTARSALHEVTIHRLESILSARETMVIDLNRLNKGEVGELRQVIETAGFWSEKSEVANRSVEYMAGSLGGEISAILFDLLRSPSITKRIVQSWRDVLDDALIWRACVGACILEMLGYENNLETLFDVGLLKPSQYGEVQRNPFIGEFFKLDRGSWKLRSPILATFLVQSIDDKGALVDLLVELARVASHMGDGYGDEGTLFRDLLLFANISRLFDESNESKNIYLVNYFEGIKNFTTKWQKPFYWLQYSIARSLAFDFDQAWLYLKNAKAKAQEIHNFRDFHITNHEARLLLTDAIHRGENAQSFGVFEKAHKILKQQIKQPETRFYPYSVARLYREFFDRFGSTWSEKERVSFIGGCKELLVGIRKLPPTLAKDGRVQDCEAALTKLVEPRRA